MNFPATSAGSLALSDSQGRPLAAVPGGEIQAEGRRVSFSFPLYEVLTAAGGMIAEFRW